MTQRIPSAVSDQYIYFVARDSGGSLLTGLTTFTVYRARNGGTATAYTTPTVAEVSSANMPGVYSLLIDEDTTITTGDNVNMMALYITEASMVPVIDVIELYRTVVTAGNTLAVGGAGNATSVATVGSVTAVSTGAITTASFAAGAINAAAIGADAITDAKVASDVTIASVTGAVGSVTAAVTLPTMPADWITSSGVAASAVTEIQSGLSTLDAAGVRGAVGMASANLDTQLGVIATDTTTDIPAQIAALNNLSSADVTAAVPTATENADALLNRDMAAVSDTNSRTLLNAIRFLRNLWNTTETPGSLTVKKEDDTTTAWTAVITSDPTAEPITGINPS